MSSWREWMRSGDDGERSSIPEKPKSDDVGRSSILEKAKSGPSAGTIHKYKYAGLQQACHKSFLSGRAVYRVRGSL